jgi:hypothetical protein
VFERPQGGVTPFHQADRFRESANITRSKTRRQV